MKPNYHFDKKVQTTTGAGKVRRNIVQEAQSPANVPHISIWWPLKMVMAQQVSQRESSITTVRNEAIVHSVFFLSSLPEY